jgi:hypothetical protein
MDPRPAGFDLMIIHFPQKLNIVKTRKLSAKAFKEKAEMTNGDTEALEEEAVVSGMWDNLA